MFSIKFFFCKKLENNPSSASTNQISTALHASTKLIPKDDIYIDDTEFEGSGKGEVRIIF